MSKRNLDRSLKRDEVNRSRPDISSFYGKLDEAEDGEWDRIETEIYEDRLRPSVRKKL